MLYINNGSTISYQPKKDSSNDVETILTLSANDVNTKMAYASTRQAQLTLNLESPHTDFTHSTDISNWADGYHRHLTPHGLWGVGGDYWFPEHPGWLVANDGVLYIDGAYTRQETNIDSLNNTGIDSGANPGLYGGNYWYFNAGKAWDANQDNHLAAWALNGSMVYIGTPIYNVGYTASHIYPSTGPGPTTFTATKREPPYVPAYPVGLTNENIATRTSSISYGGSWSCTDPHDCSWAMETIWVPLSSSVGGEQTWGSYLWSDLTTPGYRFVGGGSTTTGFTVNGELASNLYSTYGTLGSSFRNAMVWRLLWQPSWNDSRFCTSSAQVTMNVSRTNTDGSQFSAGDGGWSGDISGQNFIKALNQSL